MEDFLKTGETLVGMAYPLPAYKVIILPPSFAYGGMENPITTFVTPSIVVGDKSAVNVVCHEIAHSWTGSLVTNSSWEDFWLNEGFTRYLESKMILSLYGESEYKAQLGDAIVTINKVLGGAGGKGQGDSILVPSLGDYQDPDEVLNTIQYEKGLCLLYHLEKNLGGQDKMFSFLNSYLTRAIAENGGNTNTVYFLTCLRDSVVAEYGADSTEV